MQVGETVETVHGDWKDNIDTVEAGETVETVGTGEIGMTVETVDTGGTVRHWGLVKHWRLGDIDSKDSGDWRDNRHSRIDEGIVSQLVLYVNDFQ